jgi:hypothetical protein
VAMRPRSRLSTVRSPCWLMRLEHIDNRHINSVQRVNFEPIAASVQSAFSDWLLQFLAQKKKKERPGWIVNYQPTFSEIVFFCWILGQSRKLEFTFQAIDDLVRSGCTEVLVTCNSQKSKYVVPKLKFWEVDAIDYRCDNETKNSWVGVTSSYHCVDEDSMIPKMPVINPLQALVHPQTQKKHPAWIVNSQLLRIHFFWYIDLQIRNCGFQSSKQLLS